MTANGINLFIVDDNRLMVTDLKYYLQNRFGTSLQISTFYNGEDCLEKIDKQTHIVILDYFMDGKNGLETLKLIKDINPNTEVIMLSNNADVALAIETFREGAKDYVIKGEDAWTRISKLIGHVLSAPIRLLVREFGVSKYMAMFLITFVSMGLAVLIVLQMLK